MNPHENPSAPIGDELNDPTFDFLADESDGESELELLRRQELKKAEDRTLRALAELENYRARVHRQMEEERKYASLDLMRDLLPVWDNLGRALDAVETTQNSEALTEGVMLVYDQLLAVLGKHHCVPMDPLYQPFDPNYQESIALLPNADFPSNTVIEQTTVGFRLHDRVVRPAQVVLAAPIIPR